MQLKVILKFEKCFKRLNCLGNNFFIRNLQNINYQIKFALKISFFNSSHQSFFIWVIASSGKYPFGKLFVQGYVLRGTIRRETAR